MNRPFGMERKSRESIFHFVWIDKSLWVGGGFLLAVFIFCYEKVFTTLIKTWWSNDVYSHGVLVPFISLYIILNRRDVLKGIQATPNYLLGLPLLAFGTFILLVGEAGGILVFQELSVIVTIIGIVTLLFGVETLKVILFPISYLVFMLTSWGILTQKLHLPFQIFSATLGTSILQLVGLPVYRESIYIELPNITLKVAEVCSGVNYLIAIFAIGIPLAYLTLNSWRRRVILIISAIVIAIFSNGLRVTFIAVLYYYEMAGDIHGPYHILQGLFVSIVGYIALFTGAWALSKGDTGGIPNIDAKAQSHYQPNNASRGVKKVLPFILAIAILLVVGNHINYNQPSSVPLNEDIKWFPQHIGNWKRSGMGAGTSIYRTPGVDHELIATYVSTYGRKVHLYIGYYENQEQGKELINYLSEKFHSGASKIRIDLKSDKYIEVNSVVKWNGKTKQQILFWYDINGRAFTDLYFTKAYTTWNALIRGDTNGAIIMVYGEPRETIEDFGEFTRELIPVLGLYLPNKKDKSSAIL